MNYGIGNVKGGSGKTPTITLASSQFVDAENFVLTNEQAKITQENDVIHLSIPSYSLITIYKIVSNYNDLGIDVFTNLYDDVEVENGGAIQSSFIAINPTTKAGAIYQRAINGTTANPTLEGTEEDLTSIAIGGEVYKLPSGGGSQLYQHSINLVYGGTCIFALNIINNSSAVMSFGDLKSYLSPYTYGGLHFLPAIGIVKDGGNTYPIYGLCDHNSSYTIRVCYISSFDTGQISSISLSTYASFNDTVKAIS